MGNLFVWVLTAFFAAKTGVSGVAKNIKSKSGNTKWPLILGGIVVLYLFWKEYQKAQTENESKNLGGGQNSLPTNYATVLRQAMNPSGWSWSMGLDLTDTGVIFKVAQEMVSSKTSYSDVFDSYQKLFQANLTNDLISELSTSEYQKFTNILSGSVVVALPSNTPNNTPTVPQNNVPQNNVPSTPVVQNGVGKIVYTRATTMKLRDPNNPNVQIDTAAPNTRIGKVLGVVKHNVTGLGLHTFYRAQLETGWFDARIDKAVLVSADSRYVLLKDS